MVKLKMFFILSAVFVLFSSVCVFADEDIPNKVYSCDYTGDNELYFGNKQTYSIYSKYDVDVICLQCVEHPKSCAYQGLWFYSKQPFSMKEHYYAGVDRAIKQAIFVADYDCYIVSADYDSNVLTNPFPIYSYNHEQVPKGNHDLLAEIFKKAFNGTLEKDPNYKPASVNPSDFKESEATKNIDLGYLKECSVDFLTKKLTDGMSEAYRIKWNSTVSSTGFDLSKNGTFVEIECQMRYDKFKNIVNREVVKSYKYNGFSHLDSVSAVAGAYKMCADDIPIDSSHPLYKQYISIRDKIGFFDIGSWVYDYRIRILYNSSDSWSYGPWLSLDGTYDGEFKSMDEDGNTDDVPVNDVDVDIDDNEVIHDSDNVDLVWFLKQLTSLKDTLGQFPELVSSVFGFLPSQLLTLIGVGIAAVIIIALVKAVL